MDTKKLRQKLLDLAVRGKLVPQDPNDEPASELLKRIHEEKLAMVERGELKKKDVQNDTVIYFGSDGLPYEKRANGKGEEKCIETEIPFGIPKGWTWTRLNTISSILNGDRGKNYPAKSKLHDEGIPFVSAANLNDGLVDLSQMRYLDDMQFSLLRAGKLTSGDRLFCIRGSLGKHGVFEYDKGAIASSLAIVRLNLKSDTHGAYLDCLFDAPITRWNIGRFDNGTAQPNLAAKDFASFVYPIPPLAEQRRIVDALDKYLTLIDGIERNQAELDALLAQLKSKVLDLAVRGELAEHDPEDEPACELLARIHAEKLAMVEHGELKTKGVKGDTIIFTGSDGLRYEKPADGKGEAKCIESEIPFEIPEGWSWARLGALIRLISGVDMEKAEYNADRDGIPYITGASNFDNGYLVENRWTKTPKRISEKGELLFTCKGTVGEMAVNRFDAAHIARQVMSIKPYRGLSLSYLQLALSWYVSSIRAQAKGFVPGIERTTLLGVLLPVPPLAEQQRIDNKIEEVFNLLD